MGRVGFNTPVDFNASVGFSLMKSKRFVECGDSAVYRAFSSARAPVLPAEMEEIRACLTKMEGRYCNPAEENFYSAESSCKTEKIQYYKSLHYGKNWASYMQIIADGRYIA